MTSGWRYLLRKTKERSMLNMFDRLMGDLRKVFRPTRVSKHGKDLIKQFEGLRLEAYKDAAGVLTIGYGHTETAMTGQKITRDEAEKLLERDLRHFEAGVREVLDENGIAAPQHQFDALVSFAYNLGLGALQRSTLLRKLKDGDVSGAADEFPRWNKVRVGGVLTELAGLTRRREAERRLFLGVIPSVS